MPDPAREMTVPLPTVHMTDDGAQYFRPFPDDELNLLREMTRKAIEGRPLMSMYEVTNARWLLTLDSALSRLRAAEGERDEARKNCSEREMDLLRQICATCGGDGHRPPHTEDDDDPITGDSLCPNADSAPMGDTGDYSFICGCDPVPCIDCEYGKRVVAERLAKAALSRAVAAEARASALERERDEATGLVESMVAAYRVAVSPRLENYLTDTVDIDGHPLDPRLLEADAFLARGKGD